jgi:pyrimidine-nucleoside phosphorylase
MARAQAIIAKKRDGAELSPSEVAAFIDGAVTGAWTQAQVAALLMAICCRGMTAAEAGILTREMVRSGRSLSPAEGFAEIYLDKHSTGGVGDKVSLVLGPLAAACGARVPMLSGRGLGHTGGTLDKLEAIPGFRVDLSEPEMEAQVASIGVAISGQTIAIAPADKLLYALRDETATVESAPLIAASILSKKLAEGIHGLVMDIKVGRGAFLPDLASGRELGQLMVAIGAEAGCTVKACLTDMDNPLGTCIGNSLEVEESIRLLQGEGPRRLEGLCLDLTAHLLILGNLSTTFAEARGAAEKALRSGDALERFTRMVHAQGGDIRVVEDPGRLPQATVVREIHYTGSVPGFVAGIDARAVAEIVFDLGAGRPQQEATIDPSVGLSQLIECGEPVEGGDLLARVHAATQADFELAAERLKKAICISESDPMMKPYLLETLS